MFQQTSSPYRSGSGDSSNQNFRTGYVQAYDPDKRLYTVDVEGYGEKFCKQMATGLLRPYGTGSQVVVATFPGSRWCIVGELPQVATTPENTADSTDESLANSRGRLIAGALVDQLFFPNYREADEAGDPESPVFPGDARLENRVERNLTKSFLHIFKFGDILLKSKSFCYIYLSKAKSKIMLRARELRERFSGYQRDVETPLLGVTPNQTRVTEQFWFNPLSPIGADITKRTGTLVGESEFLTYGYETTYLGGFQHVDVVQQTIRQKVGKAFFLMGSLNTITGAVNPGTGPADLGLFTADAGTGISLQTPFSNLTMLDEAQTLRIQQGDNIVTMSPAGIVLTNGTNVVTLSEAGIDIKGLSLNIDVTGAVAIKGGSIDLFAPPA